MTHITIYIPTSISNYISNLKSSNDKFNNSSSFSSNLIGRNLNRNDDHLSSNFEINLFGKCCLNLVNGKKKWIYVVKKFEQNLSHLDSNLRLEKIPNNSIRSLENKKSKKSKKSKNQFNKLVHSPNSVNKTPANTTSDAKILSGELFFIGKIIGKDSDQESINNTLPFGKKEIGMNHRPLIILKECSNPLRIENERNSDNESHLLMFDIVSCTHNNVKTLIVYYNEEIASDTVNYYRQRKTSKNSRNYFLEKKNANDNQKLDIPDETLIDEVYTGITVTPTTIPLHLINRSKEEIPPKKTSFFEKIIFNNPVLYFTSIFLRLLFTITSFWTHKIEMYIFNGWFEFTFVKQITFRTNQVHQLIFKEELQSFINISPKQDSKNNQINQAKTNQRVLSSNFDPSLSKRGYILVQITIDIAFGILASFIVNHYEETILLYTHYIWNSFTNRIADHMEWLMGHPAGFKLNHELSRVVGTFLQSGLYWWQDVLVTVYLPIESHLVTALKIFGCTGISFMICMVMDIGSIITLQITIFYLLITKVFSILTRSMLSFWRLFRGHKYNVLRDRVDNCQFSNEQMIVGTLFLGVSAFLSPTIVWNYASFAIVELIFILLKRFLNICLCIMKEFPFFEFFFHSTKSYDIHFQYLGQSHDGKSSFFILKSQKTVRWLKTFYKTSICSIDPQYHPTLLIRRLLTGEMFMKPENIK